MSSLPSSETARSIERPAVGLLGDVAGGQHGFPAGLGTTRAVSSASESSFR